MNKFSLSIEQHYTTKQKKCNMEGKKKEVETIAKHMSMLSFSMDTFMFPDIIKSKFSIKFQPKVV